MNGIGSSIGALLVVGAVTSACGAAAGPSANYGAGTSSPPVTASPSSNSTAATAGSTIAISGMAFGEPLVVSPGSTVTIVNEDSVEHSVTSTPEKGFDTDVDGAETQTFTAPTQPGEYPFVCKYHPKMKGSLIVK